MKNEKPKATKVTGFFGLWDDGTVGWATPRHLHPTGGNFPTVEPWNKGVAVYCCEVMIKPLKDKRGRYIKRYIGGKPK